MPFSALFQLYRGGQCTCLCFSWILFTSTLHNILSKPLAGFPHNHHRNNGQRWQRVMNLVAMAIISSSKEYRLSLGIKPATSCSEVLYATIWALMIAIAPIHASLEISFTEICMVFFPNHWLLSHIICQAPWLSWEHCRRENRRSLVRSLAWPVFFLRIDDSHCDRIHSSLTAVRCFENRYLGKQQWLKKNIVQSTG